MSFKINHVTSSEYNLKVTLSVADLHTKISGAPPPTGPNTFVLTYIFAKKRPRRRLASPPRRVGRPQREILDPPPFVLHQALCLDKVTKYVPLLRLSPSFLYFTIINLNGTNIPTTDILPQHQWNPTY